jgi:hypothetical protein
MRLCLAAYFTKQDADTMLGPLGQLLKRIFERTHTGKLLLHCFLKHPERLVGIGGQYVVMRSTETGYLEKYSYTLAGADRSVLEQTVEVYAQEFEHLHTQFGSLVQPTAYRLDHLPLRGPLGRLVTLCARQPELKNYTDIFSTEATKLLCTPTTTLSNDLRLLASRTRAWTADDKWLDIIGPNNVVVAKDSGETRIRIIDTEPYVAEYLKEVNPVIGKPYREVFADKLQVIEALAGTAALVLIFAMLAALPYIHHCLFSTAELAEEAIEKLIG